MIIAIILAALILLALFLIAPSWHSHRRAQLWRGTPFAHRGLHGGGAAENTLPAFARACEAGIGIELDVQLSKDGEVVVFHDDNLKRMVGDDRRVDEVALAELRRFPLGIPTFEEALKLIGGRVPLLVEIKNGKRNAELCAKTLKLLKNYEGRYVIESFSPLILFWLRRNAPSVVRGQLVNLDKEYRVLFSPAVSFILSRLLLNFLSRPDFVAYNIKSAPLSAPHMQRRLFNTPLAAWTVRDKETFRACLERGEMPIFEDFVPDVRKN